VKLAEGTLQLFS